MSEIKCIHAFSFIFGDWPALRLSVSSPAAVSLLEPNPAPTALQEAWGRSDLFFSNTKSDDKESDERE